MQHLPVIVGFGGINAAGRASGHQALGRILYEVLPASRRTEVLQDLAVLTGALQLTPGGWCNRQGQAVELKAALAELEPELLEHSLMRTIEPGHFDPQAIPCHLPLSRADERDRFVEFSLPARALPDPLPSGWRQLGEVEGEVRIRAENDKGLFLKQTRQSPAQAAGLLPRGFDPARLYQSRNHPRGLQMTLYAASDALHSLGLDWEVVRRRVAPDQIAVYAGSALNQLDHNGYGGLMQSRLKGRRVSSKQLALGLAEMPADFVNAYVLGNFGPTGLMMGACATFLCNLQAGMTAIRRGECRVAVVGAAEAPVTPEIIDGFVTMGAMAEDANLLKLQRRLGENDQNPNHRRACRPFGDNCGMSLGESAQFAVLFDDELALELGARVLGAVGGAFTHADGPKKSISSPGAGNYLSLAKAVAELRAILDGEALQGATYALAHGTGTPQNRVTESHILSSVSRAFDLDAWPVLAIKSHLGHSMASASGDQLATALGIWEEGIMPGICSVSEPADDVHREGLDFVFEHRQVDTSTIKAALLNAKGFGGNNASAAVLSPELTREMLERRHGKRAMTDWAHRNEGVAAASAQANDDHLTGRFQVTYRFGEGVIDGERDLTLDGRQLQLAGDCPPVALDLPNPYEDDAGVDH